MAIAVVHIGHVTLVATSFPLQSFEEVRSQRLAIQQPYGQPVIVQPLGEGPRRFTMEGTVYSVNQGLISTALAVLSQYVESAIPQPVIEPPTITGGGGLVGFFIMESVTRQSDILFDLPAGELLGGVASFLPAGLLQATHRLNLRVSMVLDPKPKKNPLSKIIPDEVHDSPGMADTKFLSGSRSPLGV